MEPREIWCSHGADNEEYKSSGMLWKDADVSKQYMKSNLRAESRCIFFLYTLKAGCPARSKVFTECFFYRRTEHGSFMG